MTSPDVLPKATLLRLLEEMPDSVSLEDLMDRIVYLFKVERGLQESRKGEGKTIQEIRKEVKKWRRPE